MAKKKAAKAAPNGKEDPKQVFDTWLSSITEAQRKAIFAVDALLTEIQTDRKKLKREMQPLRVGMELRKVKDIISGPGKAQPQKETGRIWGAYRDSHLKDAGYSKSSSDNYLGMITEARKILPSDELITALLDHTNEKGVVLMSGGKVDKPFGKFTMYLKSEDVQAHVKGGKVDLGELEVDDFLANVFDPNNIETADTPANEVVAVNTAVKRIFAEAKKDLKGELSEAEILQRAADSVGYVITALLTTCALPLRTFEAMPQETVDAEKLLSLSGLVNEVNKKQAEQAAKRPKKAKAKKAAKKIKIAVSKSEETLPVLEWLQGKYIVRKNPKPKFPQQPWELFETGKDEPVARCADFNQAVTVGVHLNDAAERPTSAAPAILTAEQEADLTQQQDEAIREASTAMKKRSAQQTPPPASAG